MVQDHVAHAHQAVAVMSVGVIQICGGARQCYSCQSCAQGCACDQFVVSLHGRAYQSATVDVGGRQCQPPSRPPLGSDSAQEGERRMRSVRAVDAPWTCRRCRSVQNSRTPSIPLEAGRPRSRRSARGRGAPHLPGGRWPRARGRGVGASATSAVAVDALCSARRPRSPRSQPPAAVARLPDFRPASSRRATRARSGGRARRCA